MYTWAGLGAGDIAKTAREALPQARPGRIVNLR
jgi:hypothetical protein